MKIQEIQQLKIKLKGDDADNFKSIVKKLHAEENKAGFKNSNFSNDEKDLIKSLNDKV